MQTIMIDGRAYLVLAGDPERAKIEPGGHSLAVMRVADGEAELCEVQWIDFSRGHGEWWAYPEGRTRAPVAALREALAISPPAQLHLPGIA